MYRIAHNSQAKVFLMESSAVINFKRLKTLDACFVIKGQH